MKKAKKTAKKAGARDPLRVSNQVFIRTVTMYYTGRIVAILKDHLVLEDAAWIAWSAGRFSDILTSGKVTDVEPFPHPVAVGLGAIVDVTDWPHELPRMQA